jgi:AcrR family transcriptional regulator
MMASEPNPAGAPAAGRGRIVREARGLFTAHGYAAVSMQQIADAAGVNKATLYHHFRDKEDLFLTIVREELGRVRAAIAAALAPRGTLREQLRRVAVQVWASHQSDFGRLMADLREHVSERRRAEMLSQCGPPWEVIEGAVEEAVGRGEVRAIEPALAARLFFAMVVSQVWWAKLGDRPPAPDEAVAAAIADVLLDGIGVRPADEARASEADAP